MSEVQAKLAAAAEPTPQARAEMIDAIATAVAGKVASDQLREATRQREETAQKMLAGKAPESASKADPANPYAQDFVKAFRDLAAPKVDSEVQLNSKQALRLRVRSSLLFEKAGRRAPDAYKLATEMYGKNADTDFMAKALGVSTVGGGGAMLQETVGDVVPALLSETALLSDDRITKVDLRGQYRIPYEVTAGTTDFTAESGNAVGSQSTFDEMVLSEHYATLIVPMSRGFLEDIPGSEQFIMNSMQRKALVDIDTPCLRSTGAADEPVGLRYKAVSGNILAVNATVSAANTIQDLLRVQQALADAKVPFGVADCAYAFAPRTWRYLAALRDNAGYLFQNEMFALGTLFGARIAGSSGRGIQYIPTNLAVTDTSESEVYFYNARGLVFGSRPTNGVEFSHEAAYVDSAGTVRAAFARHEAVAKLHMAFDIGDLFQGNGIAVLKDVDWT